MNKGMFKTIAAMANILILALLFTSCAETEPIDPVLTQQEFTIRSTINGANYKIKVGLPVDYDAATKRHATVYVLDGENDFGFVANRCKEIASSLGTSNVVVISIGYGRNRSIDYTPTKMSSVTGGGPEFLKFIENQLIPKVEATYHVDTTRSSRVIIGHSYGGLFGTYAFCTNNQVFGNYILLSPSLWFDNMVSTQFEKANRDKIKNQDQLVFMGIGGAEEVDRMLTPFEEFYQTLQDNYTYTKLAKNIEQKESHMGSKNPNIVKGLTYYFQNR
ncbi:esterase [Haliscomenobacter hydrossis DSM 1100]|uniref:Esterase n=2 Tax=Haliscomenobacter TaxID=2349 RepID=F4L5U7_HALH1|nr:esterase [Haliscomenobacter hydrossis DSM 1100]